MRNDKIKRLIIGVRLYLLLRVNLCKLINENFSLKEYTMTSLQKLIRDSSTIDIYNAPRYNEKDNTFYVDSYVNSNKNEFDFSTTVDKYCYKKLSEYIRKTLARWNVDVIIKIYDENGDLCIMYKKGGQTNEKYRYIKKNNIYVNSCTLFSFRNKRI